jgi:molecular chaperone GrpE
MSKHHHKDAHGSHPTAESPSDAAQAPETAATDASGTGAPVAGDVEQLKAQLADREKELAELKDKYLRQLAESENARKRIRQQSEESVRIQRENLLRDLLPIVDDLERAVSAARGGDGNGESIVAGVEMVLRSLLDFLRAQGVTPVASKGQAFDPARHEAVDHVATAEHPPNTVIDEFHRGYQIGERILRPARVSVARDAGGQSNGENSATDVEKS